MDDQLTYAAFLGQRLLATGPLPPMLAAVKREFDRDPGTLVLIFEDQTGRRVDSAPRGPPDEVLARATPPPPSPAPGPPKLGVVPRKVSPPPRHWDWLE